MSQPEISPLARRLAEENNVDWRGLHGSGAGGKVVERDVLEYLARVMAGEEDLDPTPEPVPEGMEAWPDQDVRAFQDEIRASQRNVGLDEIQQELSAADRLADGAELDMPDVEVGGFEDPTGPYLAGEDEAGEDEAGEDLNGEEPAGADAGYADVSRAGLGQDGPGSEDRPFEAGGVDTGAAPLDGDTAEAISEDIFLFDDDEDDLGFGGVPSAEGTGPRPQVGADPDEELLVAGEEGAAGEPSAWDEPARGADTRLDDEAALRDDTGTAPEGLPDLFGAPPAGEDEGVASGEALFEGSAAAAEDAAEQELEVPPLGDLGLEDDARAEGAGLEGGGRRAGGTGPAPEAADATRWSEPVEEQPDRQVDEAPDAPEPFAAPTSEPFAADAVPEPEPQDLGADAWQAEAAPFAGDAGVAAARSEGTAERAWAEVPARAAEAGAAAPGALPVVSFGTLLRRHVDVTALAGAQLAVALELGGGEPLSPATFLLRAAAKAVDGAAWNAGAIAMVAWDGEGRLRYRAFPQAASDPFPELVRQLAADPAEADDSLGDAVLAVADMSALDVDEAVLAVDAPLLTLGRILYDNQRGSYRSTLSLAGDVSPERGGKLLARVAELLDAPVRLML